MHEDRRCIPALLNVRFGRQREANERVSGSELPISENSLFNGVNHCGVQVSTPHSVGFARLAAEAFYCAV